jgi:hypothetical protein
MAWAKVVTESAAGKIAQEAATLASQGALATLDKVDSSSITNGSIDTVHIANDQITLALMADESIDSDMYVDGSIDTAHIADDQITNALMADGAVAGDIIADEEIHQGKLADDSVGTANIIDANITLAKMASESVDEDNLVVSNSPTNGMFLSAQSGNTGGLTWATPTDISTVANLTDTTITSSAANEILFSTGANAWANKTLAEAGIQATISGAATTIDTEDLTASVAMVTDASGKVAVSAVTATELGYVDGVTSAIQTQLDAKQASGTYYTDALNLNYWSGDAARTTGSSGFLMSFDGDVTVDENFTATGTSTLTGAVTIAGDLTVNGTTTTINTATLEVEDQLIKLANVASPTATTASGAGIQIEASATEADFPELKWIKAQGGGNTDGTGTANGLTGWSVSNMHTSNPVDMPIAVMEFSTNSVAPTGNAGGVGSFHFDSGDDSLYIRTS